VNVLTGFKYIAEKIHEWEQHGKDGLQYIFGGEESYGYLLGTQVRDKDAVISSALICEVALQAKLKGKTLVDLLHDLYAKHGFFFEKLLSIEFEDTKKDREAMAAGMNRVLKDPPKVLAGKAVVTLEDYQTSIQTDLRTGATSPITLPKSNVLFFWLEDGSKAMIRPSGTEPKIKIYCGVVVKKYANLEAAQKEAEKYATALLQDLKGHLS
jgi:phosphomannomutase